MPAIIEKETPVTGVLPADAHQDISTLIPDKAINDEGSAKIDESKPVDFSEFTAASDKPFEYPEPKKVEEKPKEEAKVEDKPKEEEVITELKKEEEKKEEVPLGIGVKKPAISRDYSGLPDEVVPLFKGMSNEAFNRLKPFYQKAIETEAKYNELLSKPAPALKEGEIPPSYYEHPDAYTLTPEFQKASTEANEAQAVLDYYRNQLDAVREGATKFAVLARNKDGQIIIGAEQPVDARTQSTLESMFFNSNQQASKFSQRLGEMRGSYVAQHKTLIDNINKYEASTFSAFEDPKHPANVIIKDTLAKMNPAIRSNPLASFCAKAMYSMEVMAKLINSKNEKPATTANGTEKAQSKAGPTASGVVEDNKPKGKDDVTMDDFAKAMGKDEE